MNFGYLELQQASFSVRKFCADWIRLVPYLTLKNHVSKHAQLCNVITQFDYMPHHKPICHVYPLKLGIDSSK